MKKVVILGAGVAGLGAATRLIENGLEAHIYEMNPYPGGHAASFASEGFIFDDGPHISFTKDERIQNLLATSVNQNYEILQAHTNNHWKGHWIKHPAQCNLYGLPADLLVDILHDFIRAQSATTGPVENYKDWLFASFGQKFAETFPMQYGKKFHTTAADNMTTDWIGPRLYQANLREVLQGALYAKTPDVHYVNHFRYPSEGGFISFFKPFVERSNVRYNHKLIAIDVTDRKLKFANGAETHYHFLISSLPLPELIPMIKTVPSDVLTASQKLACTTCVVVNLGIDRPDISEAHWTYFYDQDFVFTRLSFPHMQSSRNVPSGTGSIQAEIYFSGKYRPLEIEPQNLVEPVLNDLKRCGLVRSNDRILFSEARLIPYANVIFDLERPQSLSKVHKYLEDMEILYCGRYGEWGYHWTDESFISGEAAARKVIDRI